MTTTELTRETEYTYGQWCDAWRKAGDITLVDTRGSYWEKRYLWRKAGDRVVVETATGAYGCPKKSEIKKWANAGFEPNEAAEWAVKAGLNVTAVQEQWVSRGIRSAAWSKMFLPAEAQQWQSKGFRAVEAAEWQKAGFNPIEAQEQWQGRGFLAAEAGEWKIAGFSPVEALDWKKAGIDKPTVAKEWKNASFSLTDALSGTNYLLCRP